MHIKYQIIFSYRGTIIAFSSSIWIFLLSFEFLLKIQLSLFLNMVIYVLLILISVLVIFVHNVKLNENKKLLC